MIKTRREDNYDLIRCVKCKKIILKADTLANLKQLILNGYGEENIICPHCTHIHLNPFFNQGKELK